VEAAAKRLALWQRRPVFIRGGARLLPNGDGSPSGRNILFLDKRNALIADEVGHRHHRPHAGLSPPSIRALSSARAHPGANHPSRSETIVRDIRMTKDIAAIAQPFGITVHDHLIVGRHGHASFRGLKLI
jgi:DNA repair protein RadC